MSMKHPAVIGLMAGAGVILAGCGAAASAEVPPAKVTPIAGSQVQRLQLTGQTIKRLGIVVQPVRAAKVQAGAREVNPYTAVVYDTDGSTWAYANTAARTYVRQPITVAAIQGSIAVLSAGPPVGTEYDISGEE